MRRSWLIVGLITLALSWIWLPGLAMHAFWAHMAMHMGVVAVAAPFLSLGAAGSPLDPCVRWPNLISPIPMSVLELVVVWAWHAPIPHHFARSSTLGLVFEQSLFLLSGFLVWISAFGGAAPFRRSRRGAGVIGLLLTSMHMTLLGALLALAPRPLYHGHHHSESSLSPLMDQHIGGAIMLLVGGASYLLGGLWLTALMLRERWSERTSHV